MGMIKHIFLFIISFTKVLDGHLDIAKAEINFGFVF